MDLGSFTVLGLGSGMDLQGLIDKLVKADSQPLLMAQTEKLQYETYYKTFDTFESKLQQLANDTSKMMSDFELQSATVSDENIAEAQISGNPTSGVHNITVNSLAQGQTWISNNEYSSESDSITTTGGKFIYKIGDTEYSIDIDNNTLSSTPTTLTEFVNAINNNDSGLQASLLYTGSGYKVILKTPDGTSNNLTIVQNDTNIDFGDGKGNTGPATDSQDASLTIDGIDITSQSNTLKDYIPGVSLTLKDTGSFSLYIQTDYSTLTSDMNNIVNDYNDIVKYINDNQDYDDKTNVADAFFCNSTIEGAENKLSNLLLGSYGSSSSNYTSLIDLGIEMNKDGTLEFDSSKFTSALEDDFKNIKKMLVETSTGAEDGFLSQLHNTINNMTSTNGSIELQKNFINDKIDNLDEQIDMLQKQLDQERTMLTLTLSQMDEYIGSLKNQGDYLQKMFDSMNNKK
ncbi:flagellar filament capping protein FliD [Hippea maritima]|uniref:Flagellar hook-associated protein 2 n=1 Tax=Hippea maritima (strain ATCC 700847 / DSM 10411 / MH2) TaxID=760142 RepID=F2LVR1_HIPMA|nr:flagellar filament capping protein FliD [Hippea maritima]AEA33845.1 flagellar hook-associated 2 domain-containing protein [Hippea maritima DSM 10411]